MSHALALTPLDRALLHGAGILGWRKGAGEERAEFMEGPVVKIGGGDYGKAKRIAQKFIAGQFPPNWTQQMIADKEGVTYNALRQAYYKLAGPNRKSLRKTRTNP